MLAVTLTVGNLDGQHFFGIRVEHNAVAEVLVLVETRDNVVIKNLGQSCVAKLININTLERIINWRKDGEWAVLTQVATNFELLDEREEDGQFFVCCNAVNNVVFRDKDSVDRVRDTVGGGDVCRFDVGNDAASVVHKGHLVVEHANSKHFAVERVDDLVLRQSIRVNSFGNNVVSQDGGERINISEKTRERLRGNLGKGSVRWCKHCQASRARSFEGGRQLGDAKRSCEGGKPALAVGEERLDQGFSARSDRDAVWNQHSVNSVNDAIEGQHVTNHYFGFRRTRYEVDAIVLG